MVPVALTTKEDLPALESDKLQILHAYLNLEFQTTGSFVPIDQAPTFALVCIPPPCLMHGFD